MTSSPVTVCVRVCVFSGPTDYKSLAKRQKDRRGEKQQKSLSSQQEDNSRTQQPGQFGEIIIHYLYIFNSLYHLYSW